MPIKPENRGLYPANWKTEIRPRILARAGDKCERCKAPNGVVICRGEGKDEGTYMLPEGDVFDATTGEHLGLARGSEYAWARMVRVVLTIAHVHDPNPANCADDNLEALCQRCHNRLDVPMRQANAAQTRRLKLAIGELFQEEGARC